jgi:hypothetical protein
MQIKWMPYFFLIDGFNHIWNPCHVFLTCRDLRVMDACLILSQDISSGSTQNGHHLFWWAADRELVWPPLLLVWVGAA